MLSIRRFINIQVLREISFDTYVDVSFFLLLCSVFAYNSNQPGQNYFYYFSFFLFLGLTSVKLLMRVRTVGTVIVPTVTLWYAAFIVLGFASALWAKTPSLCFYTLSRMIQCLVVTFCMAQNFSTRGGLNRCLRLLAWTGMYTAAYILVKTPYTNWFQGSLGRSATQLNPNSVGMIFCLCTLVSFFFAYYLKKRTYYAFALVQFLMVVLTSSRKSVLSAMLGLILLVLLNTKRRHYFLRIMSIVVLAAFAFYLIMNVPQLYIAIGRRFESMLNYLDTNSGDNSMALRRMFIQCAKNMFFENALFGVGLNNFAARLGEIVNLSTYAHNNYYEILADLGIIGFFLYYSFYAYVLLELVNIIRRGSTTARLMLTIIVTIMICEYGMVSHYLIYMQMFLCCTSMFISAYYNRNEIASAAPAAAYSY